MKKFKMAIFHSGFVYSGGGERIVIEEILGLKKRGYEVSGFAPTLDEKRCYPDFIKKAQIETILPALPKWFPLSEALMMAFSALLIPFLFSKFRRFELFMGANQPGVWFAFVLSKILRKPYFIYLNQPNRLVYPRKIDLKTGWTVNKNYAALNLLINFFKPLVAYLDKISVKNAKYMLTNGRYIGEVIEETYQKEGIDCPAGCSLQEEKFLQKSPEEAFKGKLEVMNFKIKKPFILITNRHYPQKRFDYVILALKQILKDFPDVSLVIPGDFTDHTQKLIQLSEKLGISEKVLFLGVISEENLKLLYRQCAVYCYPAPQEDFGMGVIEAGASGVPVVAWNHAGPKVTVLDGKSGFLAKPHQVSDYAKKILWLLRHPKERFEMGRRAYEHIRQNFTWGKHLDKIEEIIRRIINSRAD